MPGLPILTPTLQLGFFQRLIDAEKTFLLPALLEQVGKLEIGELDRELNLFAGNEKLTFVAKKGLRGELVFPVPSLINSKPKLLGYYRLLLGFSQKEFYKGIFAKFRKLEIEGVIPANFNIAINDLCDSLIQSSWILINGIPEISLEILNSLTLLTLGPQFRGSRNVNLGSEANRTVFALIRSFIADRISNESENFFEIKNGVGRLYRIEFAPDPDIAIRQVMLDGSFRNRIAIEIKGGTDYSNIHNRLGEAEKSHQKAKGEGFTQFWTIINVPGLERATWKKETPTTNELFYLDQIADPRSNEQARFKEYLISEVGI